MTTDTSFNITPSIRLLKTQQTAIKARRIFDKMCADIVLDHYNNINDTKFELVEDHETMDTYSINNFSGTLTRCIFKAKELNSSCIINDFLAEIMHACPFPPSVTTCNILTPEGEISTVGLHNCPSFVGYSGISQPTYLVQKTFPKFDPYSTNGLYNQSKSLANERIANRALHHYNQTNGTNFVLVAHDTMRSHSFYRKWIHICFNAEEDSRIKLFFAEIKYSRVSMPAVTICQILDGETKRGCKYCESSEVIHPDTVEGYRREFLDNMQIVEEDKDSCNKVYDKEYVTVKKIELLYFG